ncbi:12466_t:CDS:2 [Entrophospora sp. SA101]|nr:11659_t:CDS:2 [Entrophospora sp. SA101]CAJ0755830.1 12466_t:CDS:2 [Entrophospora sp. SA101]CAJ0838225.1 10077_t:CDS:2 [Entrophospora sp. SA101]
MLLITYSESDTESAIECNYKDVFTNQEESLSQELTFPNSTYADFMNLVAMVRKVASSTILYESKLLSIIIYSDATNCDNLGKTMKHLIYITLGNILKSSAVFKSAQRLAFMKSLKILFDPIYKQYEDGTILEINKSYIWCVLKLSFIISDLPEASAFCTTYKSYNSKLPYHTCLVEKENLNNMNLSSENILLQTPDHMKQVL